MAVGCLSMTSLTSGVNGHHLHHWTFHTNFYSSSKPCARTENKTLVNIHRFQCRDGCRISIAKLELELPKARIIYVSKPRLGGRCTKCRLRRTPRCATTAFATTPTTC